MNKYIIALICTVILTSVCLAQERSNFVLQSENKEKNKYEVATFGAGCFWCVEAVFQRLNGVVSVESGYFGGTVQYPTYDEVWSGKTGHVEVIQIKFDPSTHEPTTLNRQGADVGTQYRSVIFYYNENQKKLAES